MSRMAMTHRGQAGFTLMELVIVLVLVGILGVFVAPRLDIASFENRGFQEEVLTAVRYGHKLAVATGCGVQVNLAAGSYSLDWSGTPTGCPAGAIDQPASGAAFAASAPAGASITGASFSFDHIGRASVGQNISVGDQTITVVAETGFTYAP